LVETVWSLLDHELSVTLTSPENAVPESEIILRGTPTGKTVNGAVLEAAVAWEDFYLLLTTDDIPFEEKLNMSLFDQHLNLLDSAALGGMYTTGSFRLLDMIEPNIISFRFIGDTDWRIELFDAPFFAWPFLSDPQGVSRKWRWFRYFKIHGAPKPDRR
jgi:hypothetical protein